jgi:hypothetical protein
MRRPKEIALLRELPIKPTPGSLNLQAFMEGKSFQRLDAREGDYQGPGDEWAHGQFSRSLCFEKEQQLEQLHLAKQCGGIHGAAN